MQNYKYISLLSTIDNVYVLVLRQVLDRETQTEYSRCRPQSGLLCCNENKAVEDNEKKRSQQKYNENMQRKFCQDRRHFTEYSWTAEAVGRGFSLNSTLFTIHVS